MSEMLGNQYFLARRYELAMRELEKALTKDPRNKGIRKKLIICYVQKGDLESALDLFSNLVNEDVECILKSDPIGDDCPCPELVYDLESQLAGKKDSQEYFLKLGILWLYCDIKKSIHYLNQYLQIKPKDRKTKKVLNRLTHYMINNSSII